MAVAEKILALLDTMSTGSLMLLPPARRRQFAATCRYWAQLADASVPSPTAKSGVLSDLDKGARAE